MLNDRDSDDDEKSEYDDDALIQTIREYALDPDCDWVQIENELESRLDSLFVASEKLEYLITAISASKLHSECKALAMPHLADLYDDLPDRNSKLSCAVIVARWSDVPAFVDQAMERVEDNYIYEERPDRRLDALSLLLNDPRAYKGDMLLRFKTHSDYYNDWRELVLTQSPADQATYAYDILQMGNIYNAFKPDVIDVIFNTVGCVKDPQAQLDMILLCNTASPASDNKDDNLFELTRVEKGVMPQLYGYNWEPIFHRAMLAAMASPMGPADTINYLATEVYDRCMATWVQGAALTMTGLLNTLETADFKIATAPQAPTLATQKLNLQDAADVIGNPVPYLKQVAELNIDMQEDLATDDRPMSLQKEIKSFYQLASVYQAVKDMIGRSPHTDLDSQIAYCHFKHNILTSACSGEVQDAKATDFIPLRDDAGMWATSINFANQQLASNHLVADYLITEKSLVEAQTKALEFKELDMEGDDIVDNDCYFGYQPDVFQDNSVFKCYVQKEDAKYTDRGEKSNTKTWTYKDFDGTEGIIAQLDLTPRPN